MELSIIRAISAGLQDATIGINAMIAALTLDGSDTRPTPVTVYNYVDHPWVARKKINSDEVVNGHISLPAIAVYLISPPTFDPAVRTNDHRDGEFPIAYGYLTLIDTDDAKRMRDALYVQRALLRHFTQFDSDANAAMRLRNNVNVYARKSLTHYTPFDRWEAAIMSAATVSTLTCREKQP